MRRQIATLAMVADGKTLPVTVSVGVAVAGTAELGITALIERADEALYQAKREGRDRCAWPVPPRAGARRDADSGDRSGGKRGRP